MKTCMASRTLVFVIWGTFFYSEIQGVFYKSIIWSPDNPVFVANKLKCVFPKSRLNIICPILPLSVVDKERLSVKENLYENLWLVDKIAFDSCNITKRDNNNKQLILCNTPLEMKHYTIAFQEMSPTLMGLEFEPGKDYYFIATSDGTINSLGNSEGGHCKTKSMKLRFYICNGTKDPYCESEEICQNLLKRQVVVPSDDTGVGTSEPEIRHPTSEPSTILPTQPDVPSDSFPPDRQHLDASKEVGYRLSIGLVSLLCLSLLTLSAYLGCRLHRKTKEKETFITNRNFEVRMSRNSEGADSADGEDSRTLISIRNSEKV